MKWLKQLASLFQTTGMGLRISTTSCIPHHLYVVHCLPVFFFHVNGISPQTGAIFDGYRLSDSLRVTFKILNISDSYEADILSYLRLSDSSVKGDPRNKAIPVLEILKLTEEREIAVIETWSPYWSLPPVSTWAEFADFMHQVLEVCNIRI